MQKVVMVTGGAGFIGSHIVDQLVNQNFCVVVVDDLSSGKKSNVNEKAIFFQRDICSSEIIKIIETYRPEVICHHAAQINVRQSVKDPITDININIKGAVNLIEAGLKNGLKKIVFASTGGAIYGEQDYFPANESHPLRPLSPYGISKLAFEQYLYYYHKNFGLNYTILRYSNVYGPRQNAHGEAGVVAIFTQKLLNKIQPIINGDGKQTRDFVYVEDVAMANIIAIEKNIDGIFNIGTGKETDVNTLYDSIATHLGVYSDKRYVDSQKGEQHRSVIDITLAKEILRWEPKFSLKNGLTKTIDWFLNHNK